MGRELPTDRTGGTSLDIATPVISGIDRDASREKARNNHPHIWTKYSALDVFAPIQFPKTRPHALPTLKKDGFKIGRILKFFSQI